MSDRRNQLQPEMLIARARARRLLRTTPATAKALRREAELSQAEIAAVLGVSRAAVARWESGQRLPRGDMAVRYVELPRRACEPDQ